MKRILFLCMANSSRSQMAEGLARHILGEGYEVLSAGIQPLPVNPHAIAAMADIGIDISAQSSKSVDNIDLASVDMVITVCPEKICPSLPPQVKQIQWAVPDLICGKTDPSTEEIRAFFADRRDNLKMRIEVLKGLLNMPQGPASEEFHSSIRVNNLPASVRFYAWLLKTWPKEWTHRYATFIRPDLNLNFVLLVADGKTLHQDTLYHLGIGVDTRQAVIDAYHLALPLGAHIEKPPRTTWKGTPLHELWLKDPDGNLIEIYARLTAEELAEKPADELPQFLVPGTEPH